MTLFFSNCLGNLCVGIVQIARKDRMFWTHYYTGWLQTEVNFVRAIVTLGSSPRVGIDVNRIVRTRLHTCLAANADIRVEFDDAVIALVHGRDRTYPNARRIGAVITASYLERAGNVGIFTRLHTLNPGTLHTEGYLILAFTSGRTGMTADAGVIID